jgi:hypothetical protein
MKRFVIGSGISGLLLVAGCSSDPSTPSGGTSGTGGTAVTAGTSAGGSSSGSAAGGMAGTAVTAGTTSTGGTTAGSTTGGAGGSGGSAAGSGGTGGGTGGSGGSGGGTGCDTKLGKAVKFVGKNTVDMIAGDLGADATLGDKDRTLELWAKFTSADSWTAEHTIIEIGKPNQPDTNDNVFGIDLSGRKGMGGVFGPYTHGVSDNNGMDAPPFLDMTPVDVGWLHLSWAYSHTNPQKLEFTVNGNVLPSQVPNGAYTLKGNTGYVLLGASQNFGHPGWDGVMDEVRLWSVYRTPQQIKDNMRVILKPDTAGLTAYYQFNEGDAANVSDSTGKATHKLAACTAAAGACPEANGAMPTFVDSDIPAPAFTCAP